ncbi:MAG: phosphotransferase [Dehalococcoidia bacterium]|nr:phosphotransferase [Dehalococcoidia bacterium]
MGLADLHIHTTHSDGMASVEEVLEHVEYHTSLDVIAVVDHDQVRGALAAMDWVAARPSTRLDVVFGTEISASWGRHLLAYFFEPPFPTKPFPRHRTLCYTAALVHDQGGVLVIPHPLCHWTPSVGQRALTRLLAQDCPVAGLEACNASVAARSLAPRIRRLNDERWHLPELGSSDAHHLAQIGSGLTEFPGTTALELARALRDGTVHARWGESASVGILDHARQSFRALAVKPIRELRDTLTAGEAQEY